MFGKHAEPRSTKSCTSRYTGILALPANTISDLNYINVFVTPIKKLFVVV